VDWKGFLQSRLKIIDRDFDRLLVHPCSNIGMTGPSNLFSELRAISCRSFEIADITKLTSRLKLAAVITIDHQGSTVPPIMGNAKETDSTIVPSARQ
jgi:hypothetical protein